MLILKSMPLSTELYSVLKALNLVKFLLKYSVYLHASVVEESIALALIKQSSENTDVILFNLSDAGSLKQSLDFCTVADTTLPDYIQEIQNCPEMVLQSSANFGDDIIADVHTFLVDDGANLSVNHIMVLVKSENKRAFSESLHTSGEHIFTDEDNWSAISEFFSCLGFITE